MLDLAILLGATALIGVGALVGWYERGRHDRGEW